MQTTSPQRGVVAPTLDLTAIPRARPKQALRVPDPRVLVGALLALLVFGAGVAYWSSIAGPRAALALARDVPAGTPLAEADFATTRVRVDEALARQLLAPEELPAVVGQASGEPLHAGALLLRAQLSRRPAPAPGLVLAAVPLKPESGPGAAAQPGSRVRVLATIGRAGGDATTAVVLPDVEVAEVVYQPRTALLAAGDARPGTTGEPVVLRVLASEDEAAALARAKVQGTLEVLLLAPRGREDGR